MTYRSHHSRSKNGVALLAYGVRAKRGLMGRARKSIARYELVSS
jgi:hypothetical protein